MIPDRYTTEKMVGEHRQSLLREAEHERMLAIVDPPKHLLQGFAGKLGGICLCLVSNSSSSSGAVKQFRIQASLAKRRVSTRRNIHESSSNSWLYLRQ